MLPKLHHNSQKRIYEPGKIYYTVTKTQNNFPYFKESIFCELLIEELRLCKRLKKFGLLAFLIIYDHLNLLIQTIEEHNVSQIMKSIKENTSRDINYIMEMDDELFRQKTKNDVSKERFEIHPKIINWRKDFVHKYRQNFFTRVDDDRIFEGDTSTCHLQLFGNKKNAKINPWTL